MTLAPGARVGVYEVVSLLGAGGMGEVYRARDARLGRDVALKVLPAAFAADHERLARFKREAQVLAALNHPNIASIHGLEEADGIRALVLELVEGETLADRLAGGAMPLEEALPVARQIAEALQAAHDLGVVHRDLKPANVKITPDGVVKVLDFGLAKLAAGDETAQANSATFSMSPTITSPAATGFGVILGTAAYMAPEQAKGRAADKRSDVWAFGCVLFEMLTGKRAFEGDDVSDTLASILKGEPDWHALPGDVDAMLVTLLRSCVTKDRRERLADIAGAIFVLKHQAALSTAGGPAAVAPSPKSWWRRALPYVATAAAAALAAFTITWATQTAESPPPPVTRFEVTLPAGEQFTNIGRHLVAIARDGSRFVYAAGLRLNVRALDQVEAIPLQTTAGASVDGSPREPFLSPDGLWIGYHAAGQLKKVSVSGGAPVVICAVAEPPQGVSWAEDDTILFEQGGGIWRVPADGGTPVNLIKAEEGYRVNGPSLLPGGGAILYTRARGATSWDDGEVVVQRLDGSPPRRVVVGTDGRYARTGHVLFTIRDTLLAVPFDLESLAAVGGPVPLVEGVARPGSRVFSGASHFDVSASGTLVYVTGLTGATAARTLTWVTRQGQEERIAAAEPRSYLYPRVSPDGTRVALDVTGDNRDIWVLDLARNAMVRMTADQAADRAPAWLPDGRRILYTSDRHGAPNVYLQSADGIADPERLTESVADSHFVSSVAPDGQSAVVRVGNQSGVDTMLLPLTGERKLRPLIQTAFREFNAEISPDGRWIAYQTDASGRFEIVVRPFPDLSAGQWPVSTAGGTEPLWSRDSRELFYRSPDGGVMRVSVTGGASWSATVPSQLVPPRSYFLGPDQNPYRTYDISQDGRRFLMIKNPAVEAATQNEPRLVVVQNWFEELKRRVPTK